VLLLDLEVACGPFISTARLLPLREKELRERSLLDLLSVMVLRVSAEVQSMIYDFHFMTVVEMNNLNLVKRARYVFYFSRKSEFFLQLSNEKEKGDKLF
jgi:hypothetical protein